MADRSAAALVELLSTPRDSSESEFLCSLLGQDPPLVVWLVCRAAQQAPGWVPRSLADLAQWVAEETPGVFSSLGRLGQEISFSGVSASRASDSGEAAGGTPALRQEIAPYLWGMASLPPKARPDSSDREVSFQNQVAKDLLRAELAAQLAIGADPALAQEAYLLGLAAEADRWISLTADGPEVYSEKLLPAWLKQPNTRPAQAFVEKARTLAQQALSSGIALPGFSSTANLENKALSALGSEALAVQVGLGRKELSGSAPIDWAGLQDRVAQALRHWAQPLPGLPRTFPQLLCALASWQVLNRQWADALERAKLEALAELAAGAAHEINNPLAVIAGRAQLLLQQETDPERRRSLALMVAQVRRAYEMIADLRLFARPPRPQMQSVELAGLLNGLVQELRTIAAEQGVAMSWTGHPGPVEILADPVQLQIAVRAVVQNALEALGTQGHIQIALQEEPGWVHIQVEDDGPGIPPTVREHLFDPFYSARSAGRGLGLGLSKAWRIIVSNHHGRILVDSTPGQRTSIELILPKNPPNIL